MYSHVARYDYRGATEKPMNEPTPRAICAGLFFCPYAVATLCDGVSFYLIRPNVFIAILTRFALCHISNTTPRTKSLYVACGAFCGHFQNCVTEPRDRQPGATVPKIDPFSTRFRPKKQERPARNLSGSLFFCPSKSGKLPKLGKSKVVNPQVVQQSR